MGTITVQKIVDGPRNAILKGYITGDGTALADATLVDASALSGAPETVSIVRIWAALTGFTASLQWEATADVPILDIPADTDICQDFSSFGGIPNNAGAGVTGDISVTTPTDDPATGENGYIIIEVRKQ